ncbi:MULTISPECIES: hypothetical protein [Burkholderia]|uniref:hypothetical protein n=1 Tax=Burkholderia TaxID=32008 RepID=UPI0011A664EE|nr:MULTISPECIES: hypothetical protein [Burkholderia]MDN7738441.1 hypothetical protein [Burkholderia gladioli]
MTWLPPFEDTGLKILFTANDAKSGIQALREGLGWEFDRNRHCRYRRQAADSIRCVFDFQLEIVSESIFSDLPCRNKA